MTNLTEVKQMIRSQRAWLSTLSNEDLQASIEFRPLYKDGAGEEFLKSVQLPKYLAQRVLDARMGVKSPRPARLGESASFLPLGAEPFGSAAGG